MEPQLSESECAGIIKTATRCENVKIIKFDVQGFGNFFGFLGEYFRLKIESDVGEFNFFVKSISIRNVKQRKMLEETGIFRKEVVLYEKLIKNLAEIGRDGDALWCPRAYLFRDDLLILEDLSLSGYKMLPFGFKFEKPHVETVLATLAQYHCASIVYEQREQKSIKQQFGEVLFETSVADILWFRSGIQAIYDIAVTSTKFTTSPHLETIKSTLYQKLFGIIENMETMPHACLNVLSHRDIWKNNLMFKFKDDDGTFGTPTHCVLLDFQTARYFPVTIDVLMAIICTTRRSHQEKLYNHHLSFYYQSLQQALEKFDFDLKSKMSFDAFEKSCKHHKYFTLVYNVIVLMLTTIPRDFFTNFNDDKFRDFADGNRSRYILEYMEKDDDYRKCLVEAVEAVLEYFYDDLGA